MTGFILFWVMNVHGGTVAGSQDGFSAKGCAEAAVKMRASVEDVRGGMHMTEIWCVEARPK